MQIADTNPRAMRAAARYVEHRAVEQSGSWSREWDGPDIGDTVRAFGTGDGERWRAEIDGPDIGDTWRFSGSLGDDRWNAEIDGPDIGDTWRLSGTTTSYEIDGPDIGDTERRGGSGDTRYDFQEGFSEALELAFLEAGIDLPLTAAIRAAHRNSAGVH